MGHWSENGFFFLNLSDRISDLKNGLSGIRRIMCGETFISGRPAKRRAGRTRAIRSLEIRRSSLAQRVLSLGPPNPHIGHVPKPYLLNRPYLLSHTPMLLLPPTSVHHHAMDSSPLGAVGAARPAGGTATHVDVLRHATSRSPGCYNRWPQLLQPPAMDAAATWMRYRRSRRHRRQGRKPQAGAATGLRWGRNQCSAGRARQRSKLQRLGGGGCCDDQNRRRRLLQPWIRGAKTVVLRCYDHQAEMLESTMVFCTQAAPVLQLLFFLAGTGYRFCWDPQWAVHFAGTSV